MSNLDQDDVLVLYVDPRHPENTATVLAIDSEIYDVVAPEPVSFSDDQLAMILNFARRMRSQAKCERYLVEIAKRLPMAPTDAEITLAIELAAAA